jgi:tRNA(His) 5'-end guanylyltransferase
MSNREATKALLGRDRSFKHELLMGHGVNFAALPGWQKNGVGLWWEAYTKDGVDPRTNEVRQTTRRRLKTRLDLPHGEGYGDLIRTFVTQRKDP